MKVVTWQFHSRGRQILFWVCAAVLLLVQITGPFVAVDLLINRQSELTQAKHAAERADAAAVGTQKLVQFVASLQTGPQAAAAHDLTNWYIAEFQAICAATAGCRNVPLPQSVEQQMGQQASGG